MLYVGHPSHQKRFALVACQAALLVLTFWWGICSLPCTLCGCCLWLWRWTFWELWSSWFRQGRVIILRDLQASADVAHHQFVYMSLAVPCDCYVPVCVLCSLIVCMYVRTYTCICICICICIYVYILYNYIYIYILYYIYICMQNIHRMGIKSKGLAVSMIAVTVHIHFCCLSFWK